MRRRFFLAALLFTAWLPALAAAQAPMRVTNAWIRLLPGTLPLAGYFMLHNDGVKAITLVGASSPAFRRIELHLSMNMHGMEEMKPVAEIRIPAGKAVTFAPGGHHLMMWRARTLHVGEKVPVVLKLSDGKEIHATFIVKSATDD